MSHNQPHYDSDTPSESDSHARSTCMCAHVMQDCWQAVTLLLTNNVSASPSLRGNLLLSLAQQLSNCRIATARFHKWNGYLVLRTAVMGLHACDSR